MKDILINGTKKEFPPEFKNTLLESETVTSLLSQLKKFSPIEELEVFDSYLAETKKRDKELMRDEGMFLTDSNRNSLIHISKNKNGIKAEGFVIHDLDNGEQVLHRFSNKGNVNKRLFTKVYTPELKAEFEANFESELFPENTEFKEGEIELQYDDPPWYWGCLPGGYLWCGGDCDNYKDQGGNGTYINRTDYCCLLHDYCYRYEFDSRDGCDDDICSCVSSHSTTASTFIGLKFCD